MKIKEIEIWLKCEFCGNIQMGEEGVYPVPNEISSTNCEECGKSTNSENIK